MKAFVIGIAAAGFCVGVATAQTTTTTTTHPATTPADRGAASGNNNQAVATTNANAPQPARGANSFTEGEARRRIQDNGFANVTDLKKDDAGVWRGHGQKGGQTVSVWLDYKGNVGQ